MAGSAIHMSLPSEDEETGLNSTVPTLHRSTSRIKSEVGFLSVTIGTGDVNDICVSDGIVRISAYDVVVLTRLPWKTNLDAIAAWQFGMVLAYFS